MLDNYNTGQSDLRDLVNWNPHKIAKADVGNFNNVVRCAPQGTVDISGQHFSYRWIDGVPPEQLLTERIQITTNGRSITIQTSRDFIHAIYKNQIVFSNGPAVLYQLAVEHALVTFVSKLEEKFGEVVYLMDSLPAGSDELTPYCFSFSSEKFENIYYATVSGDHKIINEHLKIETIPKLEGVNSQFSIDLLVAGSALINESEDLGQLAEGDILIFQPGFDPSSIFRLIVGGIDFCAVTIAENGFNFCQNETHVKPSKETVNMENPLMSRDLPASKFDEMTVTVSIEVGETRLPLKMVTSLIPGAMLDLEAISLDVVKLRVNGDLVATGALIEVGDGIGIKVKKVL
jgi:flagellar motor switch/type III secretory pathway protein FliN